MHEEGDLVWVHDYHLMRLPYELRRRRPNIKTSWFLHTPFPSSEIFRTISMRDELSSKAIMLVGESGMGKTHLVGVLHELASQTLWDDAPCEVGYLFNASKPIEQMTPFFMWQAIFGRLFCNETLIQLRDASAMATSKPKEPSAASPPARTCPAS